jgi:mannan endo-1,4-beta-mannosidase
MAFHQRGCAADSFYAEGNEACLCRLANDDAFARSWLLDDAYAKVADAIRAQGLDGVPIVFRPLHEHNGRWFWWGAPYWNCGAGARFTGAAAYARVFRTIVTYLRRERGLSNLLVAYSPGASAEIESEEGYLEGYPGDEYVDILGLDAYYHRSPSFEAQTATFVKQLQNVTRLAYARGKVAALTEVGDTLLSTETTNSRWFTQHLLALLQAPGVDLAYAMTWENRTTGAQQFWVPTADHPLVDDFVSFASMPAIALISDEPAHGHPVCGSCEADPDGDRWGWEHEASCRVASWCLAPRYPICARCDSDPDGDGWGWEQDRSCQVLASCR